MQKGLISFLFYFFCEHRALDRTQIFLPPCISLHGFQTSNIVYIHLVHLSGRHNFGRVGWQATLFCLASTKWATLLLIMHGMSDQESRHHIFPQQSNSIN